MNEENLILKSLLQQKKVFIDNLVISRKRPTKDSVHDLRVTVKKMRSYFRLNDEFTKEEWRTSFYEIKQLFRSFGRLRDFDMSLELSRRSERKWQMSLLPFKQYLNANRSLTRRWTKQAAINFNEQQPIFDFPFSYFNNLTIEEITEKIIHISNEKIKKVKRLKKHFHKNAHEIRKQLKDVLYWLKICPKGVMDSIFDIKHLDQCLKYLGNWQDQFIFKNKIRQYTKELASKDEKQTLAALKKNIDNVQKDFLEKAGKKLSAIEARKATVSI